VGTKVRHPPRGVGAWPPIHQTTERDSVTEDYAEQCEEYNIKAFHALRWWLVAFAVIIVATVGVSAWYHHGRQQHATYNTKHTVGQRFDYWNEGQR
jgi:hypothetical protein